MNYSRNDQAASLEPSFPIPRHPQEALTLSQTVAYLLSGDHFHLPQSEVVLKSLNDKLPKVLDLAFKEEDPQALLDVHQSLYLIYEINFSDPESVVCSHQYSSWLLNIRKQLETTWISYEEAKIKGRLPTEAESLNAHYLCHWFAEEADKKSELDQHLLRFLRDEASVEQFNLFILTDAHLNYRFSKALTLAKFNSPESISVEVAKNEWDECGKGVAKNSHTQQFMSMLAELDLELPPFPIWEDWRPYSGYNLYFCFGLNREHYFRSIGSLAMPELFDPVRNRSVVIGLERLYSHARKSCGYFYNHIETDEEHGSHWLNHIIFPLADEAKHGVGMELAIGGAIRMEAMRRYNQYLASKFGLSN